MTILLQTKIAFRILFHTSEVYETQAKYHHADCMTSTAPLHLKWFSCTNIKPRMHGCFWVTIRWRGEGFLTSFLSMKTWIFGLMFDESLQWFYLPGKFYFIILSLRNINKSVSASGSWGMTAILAHNWHLYTYTWGFMVYTCIFVGCDFINK